MATIKDIYDLPEIVRAELIDGKIYYHETPQTAHQEMLGELICEIETYRKQHKLSNCKVYPRPLGVFMRNNTVYVEPDIIVVCDESKMDEEGCHGAPDWIIEIISPGTEYLDCIMKLKIYADEGVKEYWVVDTSSKVVVVYDLENKKHMYMVLIRLMECYFLILKWILDTLRSGKRKWGSDES